MKLKDLENVGKTVELKISCEKNQVTEDKWNIIRNSR
jgi:hypothetical protein